MREIRIGGLPAKVCWNIKQKIDDAPGHSLSVYYRNYGKRCDLIFHSYKTYRTQLDFFNDVWRMIGQVLENDSDTIDKNESKYLADTDDIDLGF